MAVGVTDGLAKDEVKPAGLDTQEYVLPILAVEPKVVAFPAHTALSVPATAMGNGFTVTVTPLLFEQPVAVIVSVRV